MPRLAPVRAAVAKRSNSAGSVGASSAAVGSSNATSAAAHRETQLNEVLFNSLVTRMQRGYYRPSDEDVKRSNDAVQALLDWQ